ncbi:putative ribosomal protein L15e [Helianthus debilis subsp. tardiflorus]
MTQFKFQCSKTSVAAEEKAGRKLGGFKVFNSYWFNEYFEVILVGPAHAYRPKGQLNL